MAAQQFTNTGRGALICYDRSGAELLIERNATVVADLDTDHPPIRTWIDSGMLTITGDAAVAGEREAAEALAAELAASAPASSITITAGEPRPVS